MDRPEPDNNQRIWQVVALIPVGRVATYGDVARQAGLGRAARRVGMALRQLPASSRIPWHRVVNSAGRLSLPAGSASAELQRQRLLREGVALSASGRIDLRNCRWQPGSEPGRAVSCE
ncbi:MGMT family protein [Haliea sp. E1-2-M8]|uniref:MGMT family protein n=1 Tax=Haliea sp. E1-2-M8 TaxID=3064706 RepID=UPI0027168954|nr:MGMT family protein [Haliea sp. E1-2-M8]MDO8862500.1 MGMT family protein [Haliea sp. E1-2-M8]